MKKRSNETDGQIDKVRDLADEADVQVEVGYNANQQRKKKDDDRWHLSKWIVAWYIIYTGIILLGIPIYNVLICLSERMCTSDLRLSLLDTITQFHAVFGVPLGFVIGHYFKEK